MKYAGLLFISLLFILLQGCSNHKCSIDCSCYPVIAIVGYTSTQLDTVILRTYAPGSNFTQLVDTYIEFGTSEPWPHITDDTTTDTLTGEYSLLGEILSVPSNRNSPIDEFEIYLPSVNRTYKITSLVFGGPETNAAGCYNGAAINGNGCTTHQYISAYTVDGDTATFQPYANYEYIYLVK